MQTIIPATHDHIPLIRKLAGRIWPAAYRGILTPEQISNMLATIYSDEGLDNEMTQGHRFWIIYAENVPSGYISAYKQGHIIWIKKLYIDLGQQGKGLGTALMREALRELAPATEAKLLVNKDNTPAQNYYTSKGFQRTGETPVRMGDFDFTDYIYTKALA